MDEILKQVQEGSLTIEEAKKSWLPMRTSVLRK